MGKTKLAYRVSRNGLAALGTLVVVVSVADAVQAGTGSKRLKKFLDAFDAFVAPLAHSFDAIENLAGRWTARTNPGQWLDLRRSPLA